MSRSIKMFYLLSTILLLLIGGVIAILYFSKDFMLANEQKLINAKIDIIKLEETENIYRNNIVSYEKYSGIANVLEQVVPAEKDQAKAVRELNVMASNSGLIINTVSFPTSDLNKKPVTSSNKSTTPTTTPSATISQAKPIKGVNGVLGIDVTVEVKSKNGQPVTTDQILKMLKSVENNRRNMRINSIKFNAGDETININLTLFVKP